MKQAFKQIPKVKQIIVFELENGTKIEGPVVAASPFCAHVRIETDDPLKPRCYSVSPAMLVTIKENNNG